MNTATPTVPVSPSSAFYTTILTTNTITIDRNLPALTTIFTPPPECWGNWALSEMFGTITTVVSASSRNAYSSSSDVYDQIYASCQPLNYQKIYSPGVCPDGHWIARLTSSQLTTSGTTEPIWQAECCASNMRPSRGFWGCQSDFSTPLKVHVPLTITRTSTSDSLLTRFAYLTYSFEPNLSDSWVSRGGDKTITLTNTTTITYGIAQAGALTMQFQSKDLSKFPQDYAISLAKVIGVSFTPTATPASSSSVTRETALPPPDLSTGAKAGIGVGAAVGFSLVFGIVIAMIIARRRRRRGRAEREDIAGVPEMEGDNEKSKTKTWFLGGRWRSEAEVEHKPTELNASPAVYEAPVPPAELEAHERPVQLQNTEVDGRR